MSSDSEGENFDFNDVSGSDFEDDFAPVAKKTKAPAKAKAATAKTSKAKAPTKAPAKKLAAKKAVLATRNENGDDEMDVDLPDATDDEPTTSVPATGPKKKKTASETYTKLSQIEHILVRPDSYIGSVEKVTQHMWTFDAETKRMVNREVTYVPGFFKIVDEILVNAADNKINDPNMDTLKVSIDIEEGVISVYNNGKGIPIEIHSREKIYIPELIFGHLLSSSNYDDDEKKLTGGRNGYGAKLANIYSHEFTVETADKNTMQKYKQTWTDNMSNCGKAKITKNARGEEYTRVTFRPDLPRFNMDGIDEDTASLLRRRVYDMAGTVKDVKVFLNDQRLKIKGFKQYVELYLNSVAATAAESSGGAAPLKPFVLHEQISPRWEVAFAVSEGTFQQVSFANSIATTKGGTHVNAIADQIAKHLLASISKKNKAAAVKAAQIKNHLWIFVNALIENPTFDSQTKETLTLQQSKFGTKPTLSEDFLKKVAKSPIIENILNWAKFKADQQLKKTDGSKRSRLTGLTKLSDANNAGGRRARDCTLILTEGDSAKALAIAGLAVVGRDNFGVFPLRGKMLNVRDAKHEQIMKNEEIQNIRKIMGFQHNKDYSDVSSLRYGQLMIMTDQDHDGSHIKGLLINFLDHFYPSLLKLPEFLVEFVTPIVRVTKGQRRRDFFTIPEYEQWQEATPDVHKWDVKYYKGLGTSTDADARDYFSHMEKHMIPFSTTKEGDKQLIDLAFSKKKADERKEWLRQFTPGTYLNHDTDEILYSDFINRELILFSMADNIRSIPSVADGLKPGQRKIIWGCFRRKLKKEIKVAQLVGYIAEHAAYHHGEVSLMSTIINLAQDFVGSNNLNLLAPNGQYGTRDQGGKDHAAPRYIFTEPTDLMRIMFNPADEPLLTQQKEDNQLIEPEYYMPIVPMVLINGADGIGTGWSTSIPSYNPVDVVTNLRRLMNNEEQIPMFPWWRGFKGEIKETGKGKYDVTGVVSKLDDTTVEITELPIHMWTQNFKAALESLMTPEKGEAKVTVSTRLLIFGALVSGLNGFRVLQNYTEHHDNRNVHFVVTMTPKELQKAEEQGFVEYFKLTTKISTLNMMAFDFDGRIKKYESPEELLAEFYPARLAFYQKRKDFMANELQLQADRLSNQARFVELIVNKTLVVSGRKKAAIVVDLRKHEFRPFPKIAKAKAAGETEEALPDPDEDEDEANADIPGNATDFDYLLGMAIHSLTVEKIEKLRQQVADKEAELMKILKKTPRELWDADLDVFLEAWQRDCDKWEALKDVDSKGKKVKRKQTTLKTRKSIGKRDDDSDDEFKPTVKKRATQAAARKAAASKAVKKEESQAPLPPPPKKPPKTYVDVSDDEDQKPAPRKKAPTKRSLYESSDDDFVDEAPQKRAAPSSKPARRAAAKKPILDDSLSDIMTDDEPPLKASLKGKGKAMAAEGLDSDVEMDPPSKASSSSSKRKSLDEEDSEVEAKKPAKKPKAAILQTTVKDYFMKAPPGTKNVPSGSKNAAPAQRKISRSMKPASPPKAKKPVSPTKDDDEEDDFVPPPPPTKSARKKPAIDSDDDDDFDFDDLPRPPLRARAARTAAKKYIDISDNDSDE
ncbi:type II DNA topoisomerase [Fistulina hepatica ATCC 64428]|uniref:DNA topoisomerase 2 n=1 Tax=Fistulina hepatica ATCC 64428 TaxID=1128425 RepID=A0A0D7A3K3_9AGAR|nr:type II DNA topoisomerase [Fistulina hepatica ATCC 64428]